MHLVRSGGTIFITLSVTAAIVVTRPFKVIFEENLTWKNIVQLKHDFAQAAYWSTLRDLVFLLITASLTLSFFVFFDEIQLWQPLSEFHSNGMKLICIFQRSSASMWSTLSLCSQQNTSKGRESWRPETCPRGIRVGPFVSPLADNLYLQSFRMLYSRLPKSQRIQPK